MIPVLIVVAVVVVAPVAALVLPALVFRMIPILIVVAVVVVAPVAVLVPAVAVVVIAIVLVVVVAVLVVALVVLVVASVVPPVAVLALPIPIPPLCIPVVAVIPLGVTVLRITFALVVSFPVLVSSRRRLTIGNGGGSLRIGQIDVLCSLVCRHVRRGPLLRLFGVGKRARNKFWRVRIHGTPLSAPRL